MRWLLRLLVLVVLGTPLALAALVWLALENTPLMVGAPAFTPAHIERAKRVLERNDPRRMRAGVLRTIVISQQDLDLAVNYLADRYAGGSAGVVLHDGAATLRATLVLPANPIGRYLNLDAALVETPQLPRVRHMRIGRLPVPALLCNWLLEAGLARLQADPLGASASDALKQVSAREGVLTVRFAWNDQLPGQLAAALVPPDEQARWRAYQARLVELTAPSGRARAVPLEDLLLPLLQLAQQRAGSANAVVENRALLVVLAFYVNGKGLEALAPVAKDWPAAPRRVVTLAGRTDLPQHFSISAALAATVGSPLSDAIGLYKEVADARGGSGFSFNDIAADRAGTRFGELATGSDALALRLYRALGRGLRASDLLPEVRDLPEFMPEQEFTRRFGGVGQPAYQQMLAEIERRIAALPLYR